MPRSPPGYSEGGGAGKGSILATRLFLGAVGPGGWTPHTDPHMAVPVNLLGVPRLYGGSECQRPFFQQKQPGSMLESLLPWGVEERRGGRERSAWKGRAPGDTFSLDQPFSSRINIFDFCSGTPASWGHCEPSLPTGGILSGGGWGTEDRQGSMGLECPKPAAPSKGGRELGGECPHGLFP